MSENSGPRRLNSHVEDDQSMAQIREILFGDHRRQTDRQIAEVEARLDEQEATLRQLLDQRINLALEDVRGEIDKLGLRQQAALDGLDNALRARLSKADDQITLLDSELQEVAHALRQTLDQQNDRLNRLEDDTVSRGKLAELFEALARQLRGPDVR